MQECTQYTTRLTATCAGAGTLPCTHTHTHLSHTHLSHTHTHITHLSHTHLSHTHTHTHTYHTLITHTHTLPTTHTHSPAAASMSPDTETTSGVVRDVVEPGLLPAFDWALLVGSTVTAGGSGGCSMIGKEASRLSEEVFSSTTVRVWVCVCVCEA